MGRYFFRIFFLIGVTLLLAPSFHSVKAAEVTDPLLGSIRIVKNSINGGGRFTFAPNFSSQVSLTTNSTNFFQASQTISNLRPGSSYSIAELANSVSGWTLSSASCTNGGTRSANTLSGIVVAPGQMTTCTFNNTFSTQGTLIIQKWATGGGITAFNYTVSNPGNLPVSVTTNTGGYGQNGSGVALTAATTYSVRETVPTSWSLTSRSCRKQDGTPTGTPSGDGIANVQVIVGQTTFCEFHNLYRATGTIKVIKNVAGVSSPGGNFYFTSTVPSLNSYFGASANPINIIGGANNSNNRTTGQIPTGTYNLTESSMPTGYSLDNASCINNSTGASSPIGAIVVGPNQMTTCTFTNNYLTTYILTVNSSGVTNVAITGSPPTYGGNTGAAGSYQKPGIPSGVSITLTAPPTAGGKNFAGWSGGCTSPTTTCNVTMNGAKTVTATYVATGNPVPNITSLNPNPVVVYGSGFSLQVNGTNFVQGIAGRLDGAARTTTFVSPTQFLMQILPSDITTIGQRMIQAIGPDGRGGNIVPLNVVKVTPTIATVIKNAATGLATNNITAGQQAYDTVRLTGATPNAGETVEYRMFPNNTCTGGIIAGVKAVNNGVVTDSNPLTFPNIGTYYWGATYSGDANNNPVTSPCVSEVLTVGKANPTIATVIKNNAGVPVANITTGSTAYDTSILQNTNGTAGGTVTYTVFTSNTCATNTFYATGGVKNVTNGVVSNSDVITFPTVGTYYWEAYYSGDANNNAVRGPCTAEILTVNTAVVTTGIRVTKRTTGGTGTFWFTSNNNWFNPNSLTTTVPNVTVERTIALEPGVYSISENPQLGWTQGYVGCNNWNGTTNAVTVFANQITTCVFENILQGSLRIVKNATAGAPNAVFGYTGTSPFFPATIYTYGRNGSAGPGYTNPGTISSITEFLPGGWTFGSASCTLQNGALTGGASVNGRSNVVIESGKLTTCTFTNVYGTPPVNSAKLTIIKNTAGQGGTGGNFVFNSPVPAANNSLNNVIGAANPLITIGATGSATRIVDNLPPTTYDLAETQMPTGYELTGASCTNGKGNYDPATRTIRGINLVAGDNITCTFLNTYTPPAPTRLKLVKIVDNDGGGNKNPVDWDLSATGISNTFTDKGDSTTFHTVTPTIGYKLSESTLVNYTLSDIVCRNGGSLFGNVVTLQQGESVTCDIYNSWNPLPATLKLAKVVDNTGGGAKTKGDWDLTATSSSGAFTDKGDSTTFHKVTSGIEYALSESTVADYTAGTWSCNGGKRAGNKITLDPGQNVTCTITNTYVPPTTGKLKIVKNTPGSTTSATFDYSITGPSTLNPSIRTSGGTGDGGIMRAVAGTTYLIRETVPTGWVFDSVVCALESGRQTGSFVANGKSGVTVEVGKLTTCTFTNKQQGALKIIKNATGGNGTFNYSVSGPSTSNPSITTSSGAGEAGPMWVDEGNSYSITETVPTGWAFNPPVVCTLQSGSQTGSDTTNGKSGITVEPGKLTTCTFKNALNAKGSIEIIKKTDKKVDKDTEFNYQIKP